MFTREPRPTAAPAGTISREKLLALLGAGALAGLLLLVGLGWAIYDSTHPILATSKPNFGVSPPGAFAPGRKPEPESGGDRVQSRRDDLAARPMAAGSAADAQPSPLSTRDPGFILLPESTAVGPAGVPSGFGHTPAGALAQLGAIDKTALDSASLGGARAVIRDWAAPGGKTPNVALTATPLMGLVKATDGADWALACVDFEVDATLIRTARVAVADCQRMLWADDRWVIGPGAEPAPPPSIWPGTDAAIDAGYKELRRG